MKKVWLGLFVFFFNIMPIYALSFKMEPSISSKTVTIGESVNIDVYLKSIEGTSSGVSACSLKITSDDGITISENIKTYDNWQGLSGSKGYSFDTIDLILNDTKVFTISATVNKSGSVKITNIICTDIDDVQNTADDKIITFTVESKSSASSKPSSSSSSKPASSSKPSSSSSSAASSSSSASSSSQPSSSSSASTNENSNGVYLKDIIITGGTINFSKDNFEYGVVVDDYDNFSVQAVKENETDIFDISESFEDDSKTYIITVWNKAGAVQKYNLYVIEKAKPASSSSVSQQVSTNKDYSLIFIIIIVVLVLINVGRIGYNLYNQKKKNN